MLMHFLGFAAPPEPDGRVAVVAVEPVDRSARPEADARGVLPARDD